MGNAFNAKQLSDFDIKKSPGFVSFKHDAAVLFPGREWFCDLGRDRIDAHMYGLFTVNKVKCEIKELKGSSTGVVMVFGWTKDGSGNDRIDEIQNVLKRFNLVEVRRLDKGLKAVQVEFCSLNQFYDICLVIERDPALWASVGLISEAGMKPMASASRRDGGIL